MTGWTMVRSHMGPLRGAGVLFAGTMAAFCARPAPPQYLAVSGRSNTGVTLAADGAHVLAAWSATGADGTDIYVASSADGATTFGPPVRITAVAGDATASGEQPPRITLRGQEATVVWVSKKTGVSVIREAHSHDGGASFSPPATITPPNVTGARGWESASIDDDGVVHAAWLDGRNNPPAPMAHDMAGMEHGAGHAMTHAAPRQDVYHAFWRDGAPVETQVAANVCFCCKTAIVTRGKDVFVAWRHLYDGGIRDIAVAHSGDGGRTFGDPVRVSVDNWKIDACPDDGPAMAVDGSGALHIVWPTLVDDRDGQRKAVFYAVSRDGGRTFSRRERLSDHLSASHPRIAVAADGSWAAVWEQGEHGSHHVMVRTPRGTRTLDEDGGGSYPAVASIGAGEFMTAWTESSGGSRIALQAGR